MRPAAAPRRKKNQIRKFRKRGRVDVPRLSEWTLEMTTRSSLGGTSDRTSGNHSTFFLQPLTASGSSTREYLDYLRFYLTVGYTTDIHENGTVQLVSINRILMHVVETTRYISPNDISAWLLERHAIKRFNEARCESRYKQNERIVLYECVSGPFYCALYLKLWRRLVQLIILCKFLRLITMCKVARNLFQFT